MNSRQLYDFLLELVTKQNDVTSDYQWIYYSNESAGNGQLLSPSGTDADNVKLYYEGESFTNDADGQAQLNQKIATEGKRGYFYLCYKPTSTAVINKKDHTTAVPSTTTPATEGKTGILMPLAVSSEAVFLWNSTFIIPWTLTNYSADKDIFVIVEFQAVQTFIPEVESTGVINNAANNQLSAEQCYYYSKSVQTVFNSSGFDAPALTIKTKDGRDIDLGDENSPYAPISMPTNTGTHPTATK